MTLRGCGRWTPWLGALALALLPALPLGAALSCELCECNRPCSTPCFDGSLTTCGGGGYPCVQQCYERARPNTVELALGLNTPAPRPVASAPEPAAPGVDLGCAAAPLLRIATQP